MNSPGACEFPTPVNYMGVLACHEEEGFHNGKFSPLEIYSHTSHSAHLSQVVHVLSAVSMHFLNCLYICNILRSKIRWIASLFKHLAGPYILRTTHMQFCVQGAIMSTWWTGLHPWAPTVRSPKRQPGYLRSMAQHLWQGLKGSGVVWAGQWLEARATEAGSMDVECLLSGRDFLHSACALGFTPVDERLASLCIQGWGRVVSVVCTDAPVRRSEYPLFLEYMWGVIEALPMWI